MIRTVTYLADRVFAPDEQQVYSPVITQMVRTVRSEMYLVSRLRSDGARVVQVVTSYTDAAPPEQRPESVIYLLL
jgi:hypothetical protein